MAEDVYKSRRSNRELLVHTDTASDAERADWSHNSSRDPMKHPDYEGPGARPMRHLSRGPNPIVSESRSVDVTPTTNPPDHEDLPTREQYLAEHGPRQPDRSDERTHREAPPLIQPVPAQPLSTMPANVPAMKTETTPTGGVKKA